MVVGALTEIDTASVLVIVGAAAVAGVLTMLAAPRLVLPVVVLELLLGIVIGPDVIGLAKVDPTTDFLSNLGLGMLFFFAGYEIDFARIRGAPLKLAVIGWAISLALAYAIGGILAAFGDLGTFQERRGLGENGGVAGTKKYGESANLPRQSSKRGGNNTPRAASSSPTSTRARRWRRPPWGR